MTVLLVVAAVVIALVVAGLARVVAILDDVEAALRASVSAVRSLRRAVRQALTLAAEVGRDAAAGQATLGSLAALKERGRPRSGSVGDAGGRGSGPVSLVIRPHPVPERRRPG